MCEVKNLDHSNPMPLSHVHKYFLHIKSNMSATGTVGVGVVCFDMREQNLTVAYQRWCWGLSLVVEMDFSLLSDLGAISRTIPEEGTKEEIEGSEDKMQVEDESAVICDETRARSEKT